MPIYQSILSGYFAALSTTQAEPTPKLTALPIEQLPHKVTDITGKVSTVEPLSNALSNLVLRMDAEHGTFILKVGQGALRVAQLRYEYELTTSLVESALGSLVAKPLVFTHQDDLAFLLQPRLDGTPLSDDYLNTPDGVRSIATLLRSVHAIPLDGFDYAATLDAQLALAGEHVTANVLDPEEFENVGDPIRVLKTLQETKPTSGQMVLLHGDFRPKNILVRGGRVIGIVDWGLAMPGDSHYDLSMLLWYAKDEALRTVFLQEYGPDKLVSPEKLGYYELLAKFLNV